MTLQVSGRVRVVCPKSISNDRLKEFLGKHVEWLESNLRKYHELREKHPEKNYQTGEVFLFQGRELKLHLMPGGKRGDVEILGDRLIVYVPGRLTFTIAGAPANRTRSEATRVAAHSALGAASDARDPNEASERQTVIRQLIASFYQKQGRRVLAERTRVISNKMSLRPASISFRSQKTRWGSCSSRGKISLNWRLIFAPPEVIDYVVIHELSHLRHYNHSAAFWNLVATEAPNYAVHKRWLRDHQYDADFLAKSSEMYP